jgi:hypothetical protein
MRRLIRVGDIVVIDYDTLNAITVCTDASDDDKGHLCRLDYIAGLSYINKEIAQVSGFIELYDDPFHMSIAGENGYVLPANFYGLDVKDLLEQAGYKF